MKTQTDMALFGLLLAVMAVFAFGIWSAGQVDVAAAQVNAQAAAGQLPMAEVIGGQVSGWALKTIIGIVAVAIATAGVAWVRQWWKRRNGKRAWRSGPNAQWQGQERGPRQVNDADLMRMMMMQQMMAANNNGKRTSSTSAPVDDDLNIDF